MASAVGAHQQPPGCSASNLTFLLEDIPGFGPNGTEVDWNVTFSNTGTNGCDNTNINLDFCCPGPTAALLDPATAPACGAEPVHEACCISLLNPLNCTSGAAGDAACAAATPASAVTKMTCLTNPASATGATCGYPSNTPAVVQPFFSTTCRANANAGVLQINGAILGTSVVHRAAVDNTAALDRNLGFTPIPCDVKVDKQVCCAGGTAAGQPCASDSVNWKDAGYDDNAINGCIGATGSTVHVRYKVKNTSGISGQQGTGFPIFNCVLDESNAVIGGSINIGTLNADQEITTDPLNPICSANLVANEPNTATVNCDCVDDPNTTFTVNDSDTAKINCASIITSKTCADQTANCVNAVTVTVTNQSLGNQNAPAPAVTNCVINDNVHPGAPSGSPLACTGPGTPVTVTPNPINNIAAGASGFASGNATGLTSDSCNEETVTCDVVGGDGLQVSATAAPQLCNVPIPDVEISKICEAQTAAGNAVRITVRNSATSEVAVTNCKVADTIFTNNATCTPPLTGGSPVTPILPSDTSGTIAVGAAQVFTTTVTGITTNACNQAQVTQCESAVCNLVKADAQTPADDIFNTICVASTTTTSTSTSTSSSTSTSTSTSSSTSTSTSSTTSTTNPPVVCRTPGFWGTHAAGGSSSPRKPNANNITQFFLDQAIADQSPITVCGVQILNTTPDVSHSALEALCVSPRGTIRLQLARQLTAAFLNCQVDTCPGIVLSRLDECNQICIANNDGDAIGQCIEDIDAFNNGVGLSPGCHDRVIPQFQPPGPAGSGQACGAAHTDCCDIFNCVPCP